jgi:hypothetical protein
MPKSPVVRTELMQFLAERGDRIETPIGELSKEWQQWRARKRLPEATTTERAFRQALSRLDELGRIRIVHAQALEDGKPVQLRAIERIELLEPPPPGSAERIRQLVRERKALAGEFVEASGGAERQLDGLRTPHINAYIRQRREYEATRRRWLKRGLDPDLLPERSLLNPLGEEALALKERLLRVENELLGWRRVAARHGLSLDDEAIAEAAQASAA